VQTGEWLDVASALLQGRHLEDAEAQAHTRLCRLPLAAVLDCASVYPEVMPAIAAGMAGVLASLLDATRGLMTKDVTARCATWLLAHAEIDADGAGAPTGSLRLQQRKRAVAQELGTTAETFSRTLAQLSRQGLIGVEGYVIRLLDLAALRRLAEPAR
jgi:CRP-like cAMP-binding protein